MQVHKGDGNAFEGFSDFVVSASARGKEMILLVDDKKKGRHYFRFGFGMTGSMQYFSGGETHKHAHVLMEATDGSILAFVDQRRFGTWNKVNSADDWGSDRGPDPVDDFDNFCLNVAKRVCPGSKYWTKPICEVLLMQEVFNGIGNYLRSGLRRNF